MGELDKKEMKTEVTKEDESDFNEIIGKKKKRSYMFIENEADKSLDELSCTVKRGMYK